MYLKRYAIAPRWFDAEDFGTPSEGGAKMQVFRTCQEAVGKEIFLQGFLRRSFGELNSTVQLS